MRYARELDEREQVAEAYRMYVTDSLRYGVEGKYINERFCDLIHPQGEIDAEAIIEDVISRAELEVIE